MVFVVHLVFGASSVEVFGGIYGFEQLEVVRASLVAVALVVVFSIF